MSGTETNKVLASDFTQLGTKPPFGEECLILLPNRISEPDLSILTEEISATKSKPILLIDSSHSRKNELGIDSNDPDVAEFDFNSGSDEELRSIIEPFRNKENTIIFIPDKTSV